MFQVPLNFQHLIGGELKIGIWSFTLGPKDAYMVIFFGSFGSKKVGLGG